MYNLVDVLAESDGDALTWVMARVEKINTGPASVDLVIGDVGEASAVHMKKIPFLSAYAPTVGDVVHVVSKKNTRALVLGTTATAGAAAADATESGVASLRWPGGKATTGLTVKFSQPFLSAPTVVVSNANSYRNATVDSITATQFMIHLRTNSNAAVAAATETVQWIAMGRR